VARKRQRSRAPRGRRNAAGISFLMPSGAQPRGSVSYKDSLQGRPHDPRQSCAMDNPGLLLVRIVDFTPP